MNLIATVVKLAVVFCYVISGYQTLGKESTTTKDTVDYGVDSNTPDYIDCSSQYSGLTGTDLIPCFSLNRASPGSYCLQEENLGRGKADNCHSSQLKACSLIGIYVKRVGQKRSSLKVDCHLKWTESGYWQLDVKDQASCGVMCFKKTNKYGESNLQVPQFEANNTVDMASLQYMVPRQQGIGPEADSRCWVCLVSGMSTTVFQNIVRKAGFCKLYVDETRWALGGWSGETYKGDVISTSCQGYCINAPQTLGVCPYGVFLKGYTQTGFVGKNTGNEKFVHCFISYVHIAAAGTITGDNGCHLELDGGAWKMVIKSSSKTRIACGVLCLCSPNDVYGCIPYYKIAPPALINKANANSEQTSVDFCYWADVIVAIFVLLFLILKLIAPYVKRKAN